MNPFLISLTENCYKGTVGTDNMSIESKQRRVDIRKNAEM